MWKNIFFFLWLIGTFKHQSTPIPIGCAKRVQRCPVEKEQWTQKNHQLNCTTDFRYVCLRDADGYLFEGCIANFTIQANSGNCPILFACKNNNPYLGVASTYYLCPEELSGCPPRNHAKYSIHQLYKYPKCIESHIPSKTGSTSTRSTTSIYMTTISTDYISGQKNTHVVIIIVLTTLLLIVFGCFIGGYAVYSGKKHKEYAEVPYGDEKDTSEGAEDKRIKHLRSIIIKIIESEADTVQVFQNKYKIEADRTYAPVSIVDDYKKHITLYKIFYVQHENHGEKRARFVFMLGEARYGKTIQCQRISKVWCQTWKKEYLEESSRLEKERNDLEVMYSERSLNEFDFLFYIRMGNVNDTNVSLIDMIQDAYSRYHLSKEQIDDIRMILGGTKCKCLVLLDGLDEWNISEEKKIELMDKGIPNCRDMPNCTIFITMSSWKFKDVEHICRQKFVKVVRLLRVDDHNTTQLTTNRLCNYFYMERKGKDHQSDIPNFAENHEYLHTVSSFNSAEILNETIFVTSILNSHMV